MSLTTVNGIWNALPGAIRAENQRDESLVRFSGPIGIGYDEALDYIRTIMEHTSYQDQYKEKRRRASVPAAGSDPFHREMGDGARPAAGTRARGSAYLRGSGRTQPVNLQLQGEDEDLKRGADPKAGNGVPVRPAPANVVQRKGDPKPQLKFVTNNGPTAKDCAEFVWGVQWKITEKSHSTNGGWVVQKIDEKITGKKADGTGVGFGDFGMDGTKFPYWEAWRIPPGEKTTDFAVAGDPYDDTYNQSALAGTQGKDAITGTAEYYDNLKTLPADFKKYNGDTYAGMLYSTKTAPALAGGTGSINHSLTAEWNCLAGSASKKTTLTVTPDP